jgi:hypothetical protein
MGCGSSAAHSPVVPLCIPPPPASPGVIAANEAGWASLSAAPSADIEPTLQHHELDDFKAHSSVAPLHMPASPSSPPVLTGRSGFTAGPAQQSDARWTSTRASLSASPSADAVDPALERLLHELDDLKRDMRRVGSVPDLRNSANPVERAGAERLADNANHKGDRFARASSISSASWIPHGERPARALTAMQTRRQIAALMALYDSNKDYTLDGREFAQLVHDILYTCARDGTPRVPQQKRSEVVRCITKHAFPYMPVQTGGKCSNTVTLEQLVGLNWRWQHVLRLPPVHAVLGGLPLPDLDDPELVGTIKRLQSCRRLAAC